MQTTRTKLQSDLRRYALNCTVFRTYPQKNGAELAMQFHFGEIPHDLLPLHHIVLI